MTQLSSSWMMVVVVLWQAKWIVLSHAEWSFYWINCRQFDADVWTFVVNKFDAFEICMPFNMFSFRLRDALIQFWKVFYEHIHINSSLGVFPFTHIDEIEWSIVRWISFNSKTPYQFSFEMSPCINSLVLYTSWYLQSLSA